MSDIFHGESTKYLIIIQMMDDESVDVSEFGENGSSMGWEMAPTIVRV